MRYCMYCGELTNEGHTNPRCPHREQKESATESRSGFQLPATRLTALVVAVLALVTLIVVAQRDPGSKGEVPLESATSAVTVTVVPEITSPQALPPTTVASIPTPPTTTTTLDPCAALRAAPGPSSGTNLEARKGSGLGRLTVENGTDTDGTLKLVTHGGARSSVLHVYVRATDQTTITGIPRVPTGSGSARVGGGTAMPSGSYVTDRRGNSSIR